MIVIAVVALIASVVVMLLVPRTRRALPFEIVIWLAAWIVSALCAWLGWVAVQSLDALRGLALLPILDVPILPIAIGAFGGALVLTVPLWFMDRFAPMLEEE